MLIGGYLKRLARGAEFPVVARLTAAGKLDRTFGVRGVRVLDPKLQLVSDLDRDASGIYASGGSSTGGGKALYVARLTDRGAVSKTFGTAGYVRFQWGFEQTLNAVDLGPRNQLAAVGDTADDEGIGGDYAIAKLSTK